MGFLNSILFLKANSSEILRLSSRNSGNYPLACPCGRETVQAVAGEEIGVMKMVVQVKDENGVPVENADVYVNNKPIGKTPFATMKASSAVWKTYQIRVKKEGFLDAEITSKRGLHVLPFIVGLFCLEWLWLWAFGPAKIQTVTLKTDPKNTARKCPMCGESIPPMQTRCPACGNPVS
jgi:hypothetical protein